MQRFDASVMKKPECEAEVLAVANKILEFDGLKSRFKSVLKKIQESKSMMLYRNL